MKKEKYHVEFDIETKIHNIVGIDFPIPKSDLERFVINFLFPHACIRLHASKYFITNPYGEGNVDFKILELKVVPKE